MSDGRNVRGLLAVVTRAVLLVTTDAAELQSPEKCNWRFVAPPVGNGGLPAAPGGVTCPFSSCPTGIGNTWYRWVSYLVSSLTLSNRLAVSRTDVS